MNAARDEERRSVMSQSLRRGRNSKTGLRRYAQAIGLLVLLMLFCCLSIVGQAQEPAARATIADSDVEAETPTAPVEIDGNTLFSIRGNSVLPASQRASAIAGRIKAVAGDPNISPADIRVVETEFGSSIFAGAERLMVVFDSDAKQASLPRSALAELIVARIQNAVSEYRQARSRDALVKSVSLALVATLGLLVIIAFIFWLSRGLNVIVERRYHRRIQAVGIQSFQVVRAEQIWNFVQRLITTGRLLLILAFSFIYLSFTLARFPWTRATAHRMRGFIISPLQTMANGVVAHIPSIIFLIILYFVTRATLKLIHKFFDALRAGEVRITGFEADWSESTYKLIRLGVVVLALVVAYPYIPGGRSEAFKGISIFIGLVFSLGSSSAIANLIAGYTMTYRRAFRIGDRVKIGDTTGDVIEMRLQVTHLKTVKNEEVIIPNSAILNNEVVNFSSLAQQRGLILHTTVGIGYETPWRQVEAMLLLAAERTPGIMKEPPPFVLQKGLGDFSVTYEINVYCDNPKAMAATYTALHRNVLDIFNEYGVQIMTPAYENDPDAPKVVPKEQWFNAPAKAAESVKATV
jgi:small-conductance mechanosensitive channel